MMSYSKSKNRNPKKGASYHHWFLPAGQRDVAPVCQPTTLAMCERCIASPLPPTRTHLAHDCLLCLTRVSLNFVQARQHKALSECSGQLCHQALGYTEGTPFHFAPVRIAVQHQPPHSTTCRFTAHASRPAQAHWHRQAQAH